MALPPTSETRARYLVELAEVARVSTLAGGSARGPTTSGAGLPVPSDDPRLRAVWVVIRRIHGHRRRQRLAAERRPAAADDEEMEHNWISPQTGFVLIKESAKCPQLVTVAGSRAVICARAVVYDIEEARPGCVCPC